MGLTPLRRATHSEGQRGTALPRTTYLTGHTGVGKSVLLSRYARTVSDDRFTILVDPTGQVEAPERVLRAGSQEQLLQLLRFGHSAPHITVIVDDPAHLPDIASGDDVSDFIEHVASLMGEHDRLVVSAQKLENPPNVAASAQVHLTNGHQHGDGGWGGSLSVTASEHSGLGESEIFLSLLRQPR